MSKRLIGSGSKGRTSNPKFKGTVGAPAGQAGTDPSKTGNADVVAQRTNIATQGIMEKRQLKKNKSKGTGVAGIGRSIPSGTKKSSSRKRSND